MPFEIHGTEFFNVLYHLTHYISHDLCRLIILESCSISKCSLNLPYFDLKNKSHYIGNKNPGFKFQSALNKLNVLRQIIEFFKVSFSLHIKLPGKSR